MTSQLHEAKNMLTEESSHYYLVDRMPLRWVYINSLRYTKQHSSDFPLWINVIQLSAFVFTLVIICPFQTVTKPANYLLPFSSCNKNYATYRKFPLLCKDFIEQWLREHECEELDEETTIRRYSLLISMTSQLRETRKFCLDEVLHLLVNWMV